MKVLLAFLVLWLQAGSDLEQGLAAFQRGDLEGARVALLRAVDKNPTARAWKSLGVVFAAGEDYPRAEPAFGEACRLDGKEPDACYYWARALYALNRFDASLGALDRISGNQGRPWRFQLARAEALSALSRADEAQKAYVEAIKMRREDRSAPQAIDPTVSYARHLYREGRMDDVVATLRAAGMVYAQVPEWHYQMGRALLQLGRTEEAVNELKQAVALQPDYKEGHNVLSKAYYRLGNAELGAQHARLSGQGSSTNK